MGAGRWGVHLVRNFLEHPDADVVAVVDPHPERLAACKERFNLDDGVVLAADWESVRGSPNLDAVVIATPGYPLHPNCRCSAAGSPRLGRKTLDPGCSGVFGTVPSCRTTAATADG